MDGCDCLEQLVHYPASNLLRLHYRPAAWVDSRIEPVVAGAALDVEHGDEPGHIVNNCRIPLTFFNQGITNCAPPNPNIRSNRGKIRGALISPGPSNRVLPN